MDIAKNYDSYINIPSSQTYWSYWSQLSSVMNANFSLRPQPSDGSQVKSQLR
jgi:hypothetical protein